MLGRTPTRHTLDKLGYALLFGLIALVPAVLLPTLDAGVSPLPMVLATLLFAGAGWSLPGRRGPVAGRRDTPAPGRRR